MQKFSRDLEYIIALREAPGIGSRRFFEIIRHFGSAKAALSAPPEGIAEVQGISSRQASGISEAITKINEVRAFLSGLDSRGIGVVTFFDETYPCLLKNIDDPPPILYVKGSLLPEDRVGVAVVGSHRASDSGKKMAFKISQSLAREGITLISGLALGIDTAAHLGALKGGTRTLAAIGSGFDRIYPLENRSLADEIVREGALLSEYRSDTEVTVGGLLARNRIVTGMSLATVVVEALLIASGTMDAARRAISQGRRLYVLKWNDGSVKDEIAERLIREGAVPLMDDSGFEHLIRWVKDQEI